MLASPSQFHQGWSDLLFSACKHQAVPVRCPVPGRYLQGRAEHAALRMRSGSLDRELRWWQGNRSWQGQRQPAAWVGSGKELVSELLGRVDFTCCLSPPAVQPPCSEPAPCSPLPASKASALTSRASRSGEAPAPAQQRCLSPDTCPFPSAEQRDREGLPCNATSWEVCAAGKGGGFPECLQPPCSPLSASPSLCLLFSLPLPVLLLFVLSGLGWGVAVVGWALPMQMWPRQ